MRGIITISLNTALGTAFLSLFDIIFTNLMATFSFVPLSFPNFTSPNVLCKKSYNYKLLITGSINNNFYPFPIV